MAEEIVDEARAISAVLSALKPLDDKARELVLDFVLKRLDIRVELGSRDPATRSDLTNHKIDAGTADEAVDGGPEDVGNSATSIDIRSFAKSRNAQTVNERVAVIAYYLAHIARGEEKKDYITAGDIKKYFIQAGLQLPTSPERITLSNAKNAGYFDAKERGQYALNAVGYNLVAHKLAVGTASLAEKAKAPRTRKAKKKIKTKQGANKRDGR